MSSGEAPLLRVAHENPTLTKALARAHEYVLQHQSPGGGFCFYRNEYLDEPNLADTWYAVSILANLLQAEVPHRSRHADFVTGLSIQPQAFALHERVRVLQCLGHDDPWSSEVRMAVMSLPLRVATVDAQTAALSTELAQLADTLWLKHYFQLDVEPRELMQAVRRLEHLEGGFGTPPNLLDTGAALGVLAFGGESASPRTADFVLRMGVPGFGFRLTASSMSPNLETTCAGVTSCCLLGLPVPHADDAASFILSCQSSNGGFARASGALPDLSLTQLALSTLAQHAATQFAHDRAACAGDT